MTDDETGVPHNPDVRERSDLTFPVVGLGASAGGLGALKRILENLPKRSGMAYVVILHLSPRHDSSADQVLQASTRMPVMQVSDTTPLEPDHVYVISPAHDLKMADGHLYVTAANRPRGRPVAIDLFFRTLADAHQDKAVGIVLSGTGTDGSVGIARIKEQGGVTFAQLPEDAEYEDMPRAAIAAAKIDFVLPAIEIPDKLIAWWANARKIKLPKPKGDGEPILPTPPDSSHDAEHALREILEILATRSGHDFRHYKRATVLRRIERRMQVNLLKDLPAYREFLCEHPGESDALLGDMLIGVTNFFRDREAFEALEREVIPALFEVTPAKEQVRVWVPACATGEEAYSLSMLLADQANALEAPRSWQVFASDIDEEAIAFGRAGVFPESIVADIPPARLRQFFSKDQHHYRIHKAIRDHVLFALHDVLRDPPFSQINLVSCRNLLIYLDRGIQGRLLEIFHFALRPGGLLFLGNSESADVASSHFEVVDKAHRIFRARALSRGRRVIPGPVERHAKGSMRAVPPSGPPDRRGFSFADVHQRVLEFYAPPSVIVDGDGNIVHMSGNAGRHLRFTGGEPTHNLVAVVDPALRMELRSTLFQAVHGNKSVETRVRLAEPGKPLRFVNIIARPFHDPEADAAFVLVLFDEVEEALDPVAEKPDDEGKSSVLRHLEAELQHTQAHLQATIEQYETSNEELKASNEELQASNEELRSASEELETSKEELQSVNEELTTVNFELKTKVDELARANDDLQNFIASTDIATLFVDPGLRIKRFTPRAVDIFNILPGDVGRSLLDITNKLDYPELGADATAAFDSLRPSEREVRSAGGHRYIARVLPYRTAENRIDGAALSFIDITNLRHAERQLRISEDQLRLAVYAARDLAVIVLDNEGLVTAWNAGAENMFGYTGQEVIGKPFAHLFVDEDVAAQAPQRDLDEALANGHADEARWYRTKLGDRFFGSGVLSRIDEGEMRGYVKVVRNATQSEMRGFRGDQVTRNQSQLRNETASASALKDDFLAVISHELKNPLNLISVNTELLARLPQAHVAPQMAAALEMIRRAIRGQSKIIDDLLDMSRIRTGKLLLNLEAVDMGAVACEIVETARGDAESAGLQLTCNLPDAAVIVNADVARLEQIIWNLLSNAIKFTPRRGSIRVEVVHEEGYGLLTVTDSGEGLEPQFISRIFEMFGQAPSRALSGKGGLGIGLALIKQLVDRQQGHIEAHSEGPGRGTCFSVRLPRFDYTALAPASVPREQQPGQWNGVRVLIADDAADTIHTLAQLLEMEGAQVSIAHDGAEALALFATKAHDIVFTDVGMPNMDGYELAMRLRALPNGAHVPLIAMTGFSRNHDVQRALRSGFDAHLSKPLSLDKLTETMRQLLLERGSS